MPKRVIDFDAMWGSDKLASCAAWAQAEYAWLYGLADASGCFELTNLRVIWGRVAAIRHNLTIERLEQIFNEFQDKGLLFVWEENGKRYGHWSGSDVPGRLPPPSWRMRLERLAPPVPKEQFAKFMSRFARGRAASPGGGFLGDSPVGPSKTVSNSDLKASLDHQLKDELKGSLEPTQAQDWNWDRNRKEGREGKQYASERPSTAVVSSPIALTQVQPPFFNRKSNSENETLEANAVAMQSTATRFAHGAAAGDASGEPICGKTEDVPAKANAAGITPPGESPRRATLPVSGPVSGPATGPASRPVMPSKFSYASREKALLVARELSVGRGPGQDPSCGPIRIKSSALARIKAREGARSP